MNRLIHFLGIVVVLFGAGCAGTRGLSPDDPVISRLVTFEDGKLARKDASGETVGVGDDGWEGAPHYYGEEKKPFTGNLLIPHLNNGTNSVQAIIGFENGQQHGTATVWDRNGTKRAVENFEAGKLAEGKYWLADGEADPKPREATGLAESAKLLARLSVMALATRGAPPEFSDENIQFDNWLKYKANDAQKQRHRQCVNELTSIYVQSGMENQQAIYRAYCWIRAPQNRNSFIPFIVTGVNPLMRQGGPPVQINKIRHRPAAPNQAMANATGGAWMKFIDADRTLAHGRYINVQTQLRHAETLYSGIGLTNVDPLLANHVQTGVMLARKGSNIYAEIALLKQLPPPTKTTTWLSVRQSSGGAPEEVVIRSTVQSIDTGNRARLGSARNEWLVVSNNFDRRSRALADVLKKKYHRWFFYPF